MKDLIPIVDLHCDLLLYLAMEKGANPINLQEIGCAIPFLNSGKVKLQVMAIYSGGGSNSTCLTEGQCSWFRKLIRDFGDTIHHISDARSLADSIQSRRIGILAAIENASALCNCDEPVEMALKRLDMIINNIGPVFYISLTHHGENQFGGGNNTNAGLKDDGKILLEYIDEKRIAIDLSHASDSLAYDIINHIDNKGLNISIIASHSNFRSIYEHKRNLSDELAQVIIDRKGLIGINFLRAMLHPYNPDSLRKHILYGIEIGAQDALCFGADFFPIKSHLYQNRAPFFFKEHENAGKYQQILQSLRHDIPPQYLRGLAYGNAVNFLNRLWSGTQGFK